MPTQNDEADAIAAARGQLDTDQLSDRAQALYDLLARTQGAQPENGQQ